MKPSFLAMTLAALLLGAGSTTAQAQIVVTTTEDELNLDGDCSLREAILAANDNVPSDACAAGVTGADVITFAVMGTITLNSPLPPITEALTIAGPGASNLTLNGNNNGPLLDVFAGRSLAVQDLTIADASAPSGAAIRNSGTLTVSHAIFANNHASSQGGAIANFATLTVTDSTFSGNHADDSAGAITSVGTLTLSNSTFSDNHADFHGGAIVSFGATVRDSTFSGNTARFSGGAVLSAGALTITGSTFRDNHATLAFFATGGAIQSGGNPNASLAIVNSTFSGNSAGFIGGAIRNDHAPLSLTNATLTGNSSISGAISSFGGTLTFFNAIVANNPGGNCSQSAVDLVDRGGNVSYPDSSCPGIVVDPQLQPLADNGGPTLTHALGACSAALDAGIDLDAPTTDQRGAPRPFGLHVDPGAYEYQAARNNRPVANAGAGQIVAAGPACTADVVLHGEASTDPDPGDTLTYAWSVAGASGPTPTVTLPRGLNFIRLTVSDGKCTDTDDVQVTVADHAGPDLTGVPGPIVAECTNPAGTPVSVPVPMATDSCDGPTTVSSDAPPVFPIGTTTVRFTADDASANAAVASTTVTVRDATPPAIASLAAAPNLLWPPNHKMIPVALSVSASDACGGPPSCRITAVASNEPASDPAGDWTITGPLTLNLRADRLGSGSGRIYAITVACTDAFANTSTATVGVTVQKSQGGN
jgi:CSLREA domain-containing protein